MGALILTGSPGVGKTSVARILAERSERSVHVEADYFFSFVRSGLIEPWDPASAEQNQLVMRVAAEAAARYAEAGYSTVFDGIVIPRWTLGVVREVLETAGLRPAYAVLRAPQPLCTARVQEREGNVDRFEPETLAAIGAEFDDLGALERCAIDVTAMSCEQAADAIEAARDAGVLWLDRD